MYVSINRKIWLYRLYHLYGLSSVISIYPRCMIYLYHIALYSSGLYHGKVLLGFTETLWFLF